MRNSFNIIVLLLIAFTFTQCKKEGDGKMFNGHFYATSSNPADGDLYLYIDGNLKGILPYQKTTPLCNDTNIEKQTLFINIKSGNYMFEAKTINGVVVAKSKEFFSSNELSGSAEKGSEYSSVSDDCLLIGLGE